MPRNRERKFRRVVNYIEDQIGADINRDLMRVAIEDEDIANPLPVEQQTPVGVEDTGGNQVDPLAAGDQPFDVSGAVVTITDDGNLAVASLPEPLDVSSAEVDVDLNSQSLSEVATNLSQIGGTAQSAVDVADKIDQIEDALASVGADSLRVASPNPLDVSAAEVDVDVASQSLGTVTVDDDGSLAINAYNGGTLPTEQQSPVGVEDAGGNQVDPALATDYLDAQQAGYDLVGGGDLTIGPGAVERGKAVVIAANSTDNNTFSVSVEWQDSNGNVFQAEPAADIGLDAVTEDYARLVRKGPQVEVTVTDESGASQNTINIHADTER